MQFIPTRSIGTGRRFVVSVLAGLMALQPVVGAFAANHPNSSIQNVNIVNMTANVDWDYDGPAPLQANSASGGGAGLQLTKEVVEKQILREFARKTYLMTEGRHRVGNIYVYKNSRFRNSVDLQLINTDGRSNANTNAWQAQTGTSNNYLSISGSAYGLVQYANVLAHEMGHYMYGLLDEYREEPSGTATRTAAPPTNLGGPAGFDTTKATVMHLQDVATRFSVAEDYAGDPARNNTAQARIFSTDAVNLRGGSAWEVLTRDPANDPPLARASGNRIFFDAFKNFSAPATVKSLTKYLGGLCTSPFPICSDEPDAVVPGPAIGSVTLFDQRVPSADRVTDATAWQTALWQRSGGTTTQDAADGAAGSAFENFRVIWADSPNPTPGASAGVTRNAIIINRNLPDATFQQAIEVAVGIVNRAVADSELSVIVTPQLTENAGSEVVLRSTPVNTGREALKAAIRTIKNRNDDAPQLQAAYTSFTQLISAQRKPADTSEVFYITQSGGPIYPPSADFPATVRADRIPFTITQLTVAPAVRATQARPIWSLAVARLLGVTTTAGNLLQELAKGSGGHFFAAKSSEQAIKDVQRASEFSAGNSPALLASETFALAPKGSKNTLSFKSTQYDKAITVKWYFDPQDAAKVAFKLLPPAGSPSTALTLDSDLSEGYAVITLPTGSANGNWTAEVSYLDTMSDVVSAEVFADSPLQMVADMRGGTVASKNKPPILEARLSSMFPVAGAMVIADIIDQNTGLMVLTGVVLKDDGLGVDSRPNDGIYSTDLSNLLPAGDYEVSITATSNANTVFQPNQVFIPGPTGIPTPVGLGVIRFEQIDFNLEPGATGVLPVAAITPSPTPTPTPSPTASTTAKGGGCTVMAGQEDSGLVVLLLAALAGLVLRRRSANLNRAP